MKHFTVFLFLVVFCVVPGYGGGLNKSIEFDRLLMHARNASARGDYRTAADNYARAEKLDIGPPEGFYLDYASTLGALGRWKDTKAVLETYFQHFDKMGHYYNLALRRLVDAEDRVDRHSSERVPPEPIGPAASVAKPQVAPGAVKWNKTETANAGTSTLPAIRPTQLGHPDEPVPTALTRLIGLYSGEAKDTDNANGNGTCDKKFAANKPHPASDCYYGYHRNISLNTVESGAVVGFVKVDYVREHRPASSGDQRDHRLTTYTKIEYYLAIRMWVTPGGLIQGQQKPLCEFMVDEKICMDEASGSTTPLRARLTEDGALGIESDKGGGPRVYTKVRTVPDVVRPDVARAVPSLANFMNAPTGPGKPVEIRSKTNSLGDTAGRTDEEDDALALAAAS